MSEPGTVDVLVVEDELLLRDVFVTSLHTYFPGVEVDEAVDGAEAIAKMKGGCYPRLVITNLRMPNVDGEALLDWIRKERPAVTVVAISTDTTEAAFDDYLEKPFELHDFLACVSHWLDYQPLDPPPDVLGSILA